MPNTDDDTPARHETLPIDGATALRDLMSTGGRHLQYSDSTSPLGMIYFAGLPSIYWSCPNKMIWFIRFRENITGIIRTSTS